jgi:hypothetical protein
MMKKILRVFAIGLAIVGALNASACSSGSTPTTTVSGPGSGGAIVNSDSVVTAKIQAIQKTATGYPWELDVLIQTSTDVDKLPNPVKDSVGKVVTAKTDQDMAPFKTGQVVTARIKYVGDVPKPGITLYIYNIAPQTRP